MVFPPHLSVAIDAVNDGDETGEYQVRGTLLDPGGRQAATLTAPILVEADGGTLRESDRGGIHLLLRARRMELFTTARSRKVSLLAA